MKTYEIQVIKTEVKIVRVEADNSEDAQVTAERLFEKAGITIYSVKSSIKVEVKK